MALKGVIVKSTIPESQLIQANRLALNTEGKSLKPGVAVSQKSVLPQGTVVEVLVKQAQPVLILEGSGVLFQGNIKGRFTVGQRLLLKVLDPNSSPPRMKLLNESQLPLSNLAGNNPFLRSLLFREQPLIPVQQYLVSLLNNKAQSKSLESKSIKSLFQALGEGKSLADLEKLSIADLLNERLVLPKKVDGNWVLAQLKNSGLFFENSLLRPAIPEFLDLKRFLLLLLQAGDADNNELSKLLESITSSQIKSLATELQGGVYYSCLLPFLSGEFIQMTVMQGKEQKSRDQWQIHLESNTASMGCFKVEILLQEKIASIFFRSDQNWLVSLINNTKENLIERVETVGVSISGIQVSDIAKPGPYKEKLSHAILDMKV